MTSVAGITRDFRYRWTYWRDMQRYALRRLAHRYQAYQERKHWPQWQACQATPPSLSVAMVTMNSARRIAPLIRYCAQWRQQLDDIELLNLELVVGVDRKTTDDTWAVCKALQAEGLIQQLFWIENDAQTCNGMLQAMVAQCHSQWILRLDDDEFPEPNFLSAYRYLTTQPAYAHYTHYKLPRLHVCWPQNATSLNASRSQLNWVNDGYLYPDYQLRLFRNDPALLSFPQAVGHTSIGCAGPRGKLHSVNLVHLNLAINAPEQRRAKLEKYINRLNGAWAHPVNEHALLYEQFGYRQHPYTPPNSNFMPYLFEALGANI